jgi:hypothetical protein
MKQMRNAMERLAGAALSFCAQFAVGSRVRILAARSVPLDVNDKGSFTAAKIVWLVAGSFCNQPKFSALSNRYWKEELMKRTLAILATVATVGASAVTAPAQARGIGPGLAFGLAAGALAAGAAGAYGYYGPGYGYYGYGPGYYGHAYYGPGYAYNGGPYWRHRYWHHHY